MLLLSTVGVVWLETPEEVDDYLPALSGFQRSVARSLEGAF
jgi:hypothetical protein